MQKRNPFLLAIDQGTTGTTVLVIAAGDATRVIGRATVDFPQYFPKTGWVEHDLEEIWASVQKAACQALEAAQSRDSKFHPKDLVAIGLTNQRETLCVYDRKTLQPLQRAIVWQCKRSTAICQRLKQQGNEGLVRQKTGLLIDPYFSGSKILWLMEEQPEIAKSLREGTAVLGTIDTFLVSRLTQGKSFVTEASNASRTLLFDLKEGVWDRELCELFGVPRADVLPELQDSAGLFGHTAGLGFLPDGIPITGILGDQQAALAGQTCFQTGEAKCTYGTGAFLLLQLGFKPVLSQNGLLTTVSWRLKGQLSYALEGSAFIAGAAVQFMRDKLGFVSAAVETEALAADTSAAPEIYFVPALTGLGAPWWTPEARGAFFGLTRGTSKNQMIRAGLEGIAFQVCDLLSAMAQDRQGALKILRVDGGASANNLLMQMQADLGNITVERPSNLETTAFGAALFAGLGVGLYSSLEELQKTRQVDTTYRPAQGPVAQQSRTLQLQGWQRAVKAAQVFAG